MAWLPMYLLEKDVEFLNDWLNQEEEIAFLVSDGQKRWIAKEEHNILADIGTQLFGDGHGFLIPNFVEYELWHVPSGHLPLLDSNEDGKIDNPWLGWTELRTGVNSRIPYFGAGHPGVIHLEIKLPHDEEIRMSNFGWIGNHYKIIGNGAEPTTEKFWNKLRRMAKKVGTQIPRCNVSDGKKEVFAFPTAYTEIKNGRLCALNP
jgi:hypothetical protein